MEKIKETSPEMVAFDLWRSTVQFELKAWDQAMKVKWKTTHILLGNWDVETVWTYYINK